MYAEKTEEIEFSSLIKGFSESVNDASELEDRLSPLFESEEEYESFRKRHEKASVPLCEISSYSGNAWLGADCGSTTTKLVLISEDNSILYSYYGSNHGNPVELIHKELIKIRELCGDRIRICGSAVTGYGEELIKNAFRFDSGTVETVAHFTAARHFRPDVDFILDIGGQDIKCFRIKNGAIDSIMLNEACSSGCGSFIETFAVAMGYSVADFARKGIFASAPVNLGSRCTVFMNSSVKQAQKDGATVEDISAGLSVSVVKNAIYKVIRAVKAEELGKNIVVQGGTFYNDAVLRAFEKEVGAEVIRPSVAGLMGAYGAALRVRKMKESSLLSTEELKSFVHTSSAATCRGCANNCRLTVNSFGNGKKFISGNQCSKGSGKGTAGELPNIFEWKRAYLKSLPRREGSISIGIPLTLSTYELAPLWHGIFTSLGFRVIFSEPSTRRTYEKGQLTIPSDTACYPAKIMHGHMLELMEKTENIFYPGLTYNINEHLSDNHYNCPVVAYYGELLNGNMEELKKVNFLHPFLNLQSAGHLSKTLLPTVKALDSSIDIRKLRKAVKAGFTAYEKYKTALASEGERIINEARKRNARIMILAGRPYHTDPEISHGIDKLAVSLGFAVVSEDSVCHLTRYRKVGVLDQWTFHSRLYRSAYFAVENKDIEFVQLVSFGCGVDAVTTDEVREILESGGKHYTQLKIDEITNNGAVKIRLRSLLGALEEENE